MKRSEMVDLIANVMEQNFDGNNGSWNSDANKVLEAIENAGMKPPEISSMYCADCDNGRTIFTWEKE